MTREVKVVTWCLENRLCPRDGKNNRKIPIHLFEVKFVRNVLYTITELSYVLSFFDLSCRSIPNKFFSTCWSVFHRFCPVLPFLRFANLKLAFSLKKPFGILEKQYLLKIIFVS